MQRIVITAKNIFYHHPAGDGRDFRPIGTTEHPYFSEMTELEPQYL